MKNAILGILTLVICGAAGLGLDYRNHSQAEAAKQAAIEAYNAPEAAGHRAAVRDLKEFANRAKTDAIAAQAAVATAERLSKESQ